jgi:thiosulfate/3-mercaptopyruvate sulfurtransferase
MSLETFNFDRYARRRSTHFRNPEVPVRHALALLATLVLTFPEPDLALAAGSPRETLVVSTAWLAQHLKDPDLVLLHVGDKAEYDKAHIPGAQLVSLQDISVSDQSGNGLRLEMPTNELLREKLMALGISDNSHVVVYFGQDWFSPTTRLLFTLDYAGLGDRSSLLDGGQRAWTRAAQPVTAEVPAARSGTLSPLKTRPIIVTKEYVRENLGKPGQAVVDARDAGFYDGVKTGGGMDHPHRPGHIAGAGSFPFSEIADVNLVLRATDELKARLDKAGVKPGDTVIGYCHLGQQATAMLFAARTLGHKVLLYDGSFEDWTRFAEYPVANPAAREKP